MRYKEPFLSKNAEIGQKFGVILLITRYLYIFIYIINIIIYKIYAILLLLSPIPVNKY